MSIDLDLDTQEAADQFVTKMRTIWQGAGTAVMMNPRGRILASVEHHEY